MGHELGGQGLRGVGERVIRLRAERRVGELLRETAEREERHTQRKGGSTVSSERDTVTRASVPTLKALGITRDQSSDWPRRRGGGSATLLTREAGPRCLRCAFREGNVTAAFRCRSLLVTEVAS